MEGQKGQQQQQQPRPHRAMLAQYYGGDNKAATTTTTTTTTKRHRSSGDKTNNVDNNNLVANVVVDDNPLNLDGPSFDADLYTQKLIREASLSQLMAKEAEIVRRIGGLDSDMQTLVYENYNKFIAATDTIKKMRVDFRAMEDEMDQLASKMQNITSFSGQVSDTLRDRRQRIGQLSGTHALLKKLQFLFELPAKLTECMGEDDLATGVRYYLRAQRVLEQYEHMNSFKGIKTDCDRIMVQLKEKLCERLRSADTTAEDLALCVDLLLQLQEPADRLCDIYLSTAKVKLEESLDVLDQQLKLCKGTSSSLSSAYQMPMDLLEFVDYGCNSFVSDLCLVVASFKEMFLPEKAAASSSVIDEKMAAEKITSFTGQLIRTFLDHLRARLRAEKKLEDTAVHVRALDRFHRRLQAMSRLLPTIDFSRAALDLVLEAAELHCGLALDQLKTSLQESLMGARQTLAAGPRRAMTDHSHDAEDSSSGSTSFGSSAANLRDLNASLLSSLSDGLRHHLATLQLFLDPELTFAVKTYFRARFCRDFVREGVLVAFLAHVRDVAHGFCHDPAAEKTPPPMLLLLLSKTCLDLQLGTTQYLVNLVDEQFFIDDCANLTSVSKVNDNYKAVSQVLLNQYVRSQGAVLSQMLRKSVETRDWLNAVEPRTVRAVMKRVVEEVTAIDRQVGQVYEEGSRQTRSSDTSRKIRTSQAISSRQQQQQQHVTSSLNSKSNWSVSTSQLDASLASNIQKMFNERIVIFSKVEFSRVSVLTGVVKIALKTLLECVRMRTFSRFGFQQVQVDVHYLHLYLWRFVSDENLVSFLLDEIMTSAVHRCADPVLMEGSVVDVICDQS